MLISVIALYAVAVLPADSVCVAHRARVCIDPATSGIDVVDTVSLGGRETQFACALNRSLELHSIPGVAIIDPDTTAAWDIPGDVARVVRLAAHEGLLPDPLVLDYAGRLHHGFEGRGEYARGFETTAGIIDTVGVFLSGSSFWLPTIPDRMIRFRLRAELPPGWDCVSQGRRITGTGHTTWQCDHPMEEAYLVAGRFHQYEQPCEDASAQAYLLTPDSTLAQTYLDATCRYMALYDSMIGSYAYEKFALVENFWQTGYGMPSFTLLGSVVIRLPFIVHTSYGHEILHNWFGNGVYVDYESGNWCEGLTAYLADHYYKERAGQDRDYRLRQLQHYQWYTAGRADIPLTQFTERHSSATEAVGYGKSAMVFHMLRRELGDRAFFSGVRAFYRDHLFRRATWESVEGAFSVAAGRPLAGFFQQWVHGTGAPSIDLDLAEPVSGGVRIKLTQSEPAYSLGVPLEVTIAEGDSVEVRNVRLMMTGATLDTLLTVEGAVRRVVVDPGYDVFRLLTPGEGPPGIGRILGADTVAVLSGPLDSVIVASWPAEGAVRVVATDDPDARAVVVLGDSPALRTALSPFIGADIAWAGNILVADTDSIPAGQTIIAVGEASGAARCWIRPAVGIDAATLAAVV
ncbi:MAG: hypothetical protein MUE60_05080, partial [Candidatus Eisenbacteria bacterium]|nr:hypothetical protein [Candidatus Eisenbacteria bacterium]